MKFWQLILGFSLMLSIVFLSFQSRSNTQSSSLLVERGNPESISTTFAYDQNTFLNSLSSSNFSKNKYAKGVIIPHHLLASPLIVKGISMLSVIDPQSTVILLSPNHANLGSCDIVSSNLPWSTPYGEVEIDKKLQDEYLVSKQICIDNYSIKEEHGIATILPYLKYFYPQVKVLPLAFKKNISEEKLEKIASLLSQTLKYQTNFLISSIDFSHNLSLSESQKKDLLTEKYIEYKDVKTIKNLSSDFLDSPSVLINTLQIAQKNDLTTNQENHKSSYDFGSNSGGVTSYFVYSLTPKQTDQNLTLLFGGDVMLGRSVNTQIRNFADYAWPTKLISEFTKQSDLFLINLESPFKSGCEPTDKGMVFCAHPNSVATLVSAGVDVVNIANNHIYNQGKEGLLETIDILNKNNIVFVGADPRVRPLDNPFSSIITIKNTKIAILGFNDIAPFPQEVNKLTVENLTSQIKGVRSQADLVIVTFHWGNEYQKASPRQKEYAHLAIDQGADAVIGAHPHWVQEFEEYQGKPVYYSLGNLVFDQMWSEETKSGLLVKLTYQNKKLIKTENFPVKIENYGQPYIIKL